MSEPTRPMVSVIGASAPVSPALEALCLALGERLLDAGFRLATGGMRGVMEAVSKGARASARWQHGDILAILPGYDRSTANPYVDIAIPTGMQLARNVVLVAMADVVVAVSGGSGTLSELALAWQLGKPIVGLEPAGGWGARFGGQCLDERREEPIYLEASPEAVVSRALALLQVPRREPGEIGSGWWKRPPGGPA